MKKTFKQFLNTEQPEEAWEDILHHIAEEELISCKVFHITKVGRIMKVMADCNDKPRKLGHQADLSEKLNKRLKLHSLPDIGKVTAKVYHTDVDPR